MIEDATATERGSRHHWLVFGWPLVRVQQDQSSYGPPLPTHLGLSSPWENPTSVSLGAVLVDVLVVFAVVSAVVLLAAALMIALVRRRAGIRIAG